MLHKQIFLVEKLSNFLKNKDMILIKLMTHVLELLMPIILIYWKWYLEISEFAKVNFSISRSKNERGIRICTEPKFLLPKK